MAGEGSIDERVDLDRLKAEHPSWRLFRAHPALGLEETEGDCVLAPSAGELGVAWLTLDLAEQRARERDLQHELLRRGAGCAGGGDMVLHIDGDGDPLCIGVWMDRWKAPMLERELLNHVWEEARGREQPASTVDVRRRQGVDRAFRAHLLVTWSRHGAKVALGAFGLVTLLGWHPLGNNDWGDAGVLLVGGLATAFAIDRLVNRWYRRSHSGPAE
jgi:hypothetical protein